MSWVLKYLSSLARLTAIFALIASATAFAETRQEHVHHMAHGVMPFDISQTVHIFKMTESGGVQKVIAKDPAATDQIALIQRHLQHEAENFQQGDYSPTPDRSEREWSTASIQRPQRGGALN